MAYYQAPIMATAEYMDKVSELRIRSPKEEVEVLVRQPKKSWHVPQTVFCIIVMFVVHNALYNSPTADISPTIASLSLLFMAAGLIWMVS